jgi:PEGA domain
MPSAPPAKSAEKKMTAPRAEEKSATLAKPVSKQAVPKAAAAAAGAGGFEASVSSPDVSETEFSAPISAESPTVEEPETPSAYMSSAVADEPQVETFEPQVEEDGPKIAVDPMMAEGGSKGSSGVSFSEMTELPPLKEVYIPPPPPPVSSYQPVQAGPAPTTVFQGGPTKKDEKPKVQPREVAEKAIKEIKSVPPKLMLYALSAAGILILIIGIGVTMYVHSLGGDDDSGAPRPTAAAEAPAQPEATQPAPTQAPAPAPAAAQPAETQPAPAAEEEAPAQPVAHGKERNSKKKVVAPAPVIPGQLAVDSTPQGAQVQVDGKTDPSYVTPFVVTNLQPGQHSITVSKPGYASDSRTVNVTSGYRMTSVVHLAQVMATLVVKSDPAGANIYVDGRDVGAKTPAQVSVDKGQHVVLVRMTGYIDETMNAQFVLGQTFNFSPTLRSLGNTDNIRTVGKMSKLFGGKGAQAGQATVSVRTQPKGAQIAINQHMLEKNSPVDVALDPGNYVVDITLSGYAPIHKVITADKGGKVVVDEVLQPQ